jgi:hypothetical protein
MGAQITRQRKLSPPKRRRLLGRRVGGANCGKVGSRRLRGLEVEDRQKRKVRVAGVEYGFGKRNLDGGRVQLCGNCEMGRHWRSLAKGIIRRGNCKCRG